MSLDDFDFNQLVHFKPKGKNKAKTLSRIRADELKNKYVEMAIPLPDTDLDKIQASNYIFKKIDLGKQTHQGTIEDVKSSFQHLVAMLNEEREK